MSETQITVMVRNGDINKLKDLKEYYMTEWEKDSKKRVTNAEVISRMIHEKWKVIPQNGH